MSKKYLDYDGALYMFQKLKTVFIPSSRTINGKALTTNIVLTASDIGVTGGAAFKGVVNTGTDISGLTAYNAGWYWLVGTAGTYAGETCEAGDMIFCISDYATAYSAADFSVVQTNLDIASITNSDIDIIVAS